MFPFDKGGGSVKVKRNIIQITKIIPFSVCFILLFGNPAYAHDPIGWATFAIVFLGILVFSILLVFIAGFQLYKKKKGRHTHFIRSIILAAVGIFILTWFIDFGGIIYIRMKHKIIKGKKTGIIDMSDIVPFWDYYKFLDLKSFATLPNLKILNLGRVPTRDEELVHLSKLKSLEILRINSWNITDEGIEYLLPLENLKELDLRESKISDRGLKHLSKLKSLQILWVGSGTITDEGVEHLLPLEKLRELALGGWGDNVTDITDEGLRQLANLKSLEILRIHSRKITDEGIEYLLPLENLKELELGKTKISDQGLKHISKLKSLEFLNPGYGASIGDEGVSYLTSLKNLKGLRLGGSQISNEGLKHLSKLKSLEYLDLSFAKSFTDEGVSYLVSLENLKELNLRGTKNSSGTNITEKCFVHLSQMKSLRKLDLSLVFFPDEDRKYLATSLPNCKIKWNDLEACKK